MRDFVSTKNSWLEKISLEKATKTTAITEFHGFNDFSLELLDFYLDKGIIPDSMRGDIKEMLLVTEEASPEARLYQNVKEISESSSARGFPLFTGG